MLIRKKYIVEGCKWKSPLIECKSKKSDRDCNRDDWRAIISSSSPSRSTDMAETLWIPKFLLIALVLIPFRVNSQCEFRFNRRNKVFEFNLASSVKNHPHGALSEDGYSSNSIKFQFLHSFRSCAYTKRECNWMIRFYRVEANSTVLWFQVVLYIRFTLCFCIIICCKLVPTRESNR